MPENMLPQIKPKKKPRGKPFAKGNKIGAAGRPEGSKNHTNLNLWLGQIWQDIGDVEQIDNYEKRIEVCKWAVGAILSKVMNLPATPGDSVGNAALMAAMETQARIKDLASPIEIAPSVPQL